MFVGVRPQPLAIEPFIPPFPYKIPLMRAGGHLQRAARIHGLRNQTSRLAAYLKERFSWGLMPAVLVQVVAGLAVEDHEDSPEELKRLARLGSDGKYPNHCHQELVELLKSTSQLPDPTAIHVPMKTPKRKLIGDNPPPDMELETTMMAPFQVFGDMYHQHPRAFAQRFAGVDDIAQVPNALKKFWQEVPEDDPRKAPLRQALLSRPDLSEDSMWERAVPIAIHGDGFPVAKVSMEAVSWSGMLGHFKSTVDQKILVSGMIDKCKSENTQYTWWQALIWGFAFLHLGVGPGRFWTGEVFASAAKAGQKIANGLFAVVWTIKGDLEWIANGLRLEHTSGVFPCSWCQATACRDATDRRAYTLGLTAAPWYDYSDTAVWRTLTWTSILAWQTAHGGLDAMHPLFSLPGVSIFNLLADALHVIDLGFTHHVLGNVFFHICHYTGHRFGPAPGTRVHRLFERIVIQYRNRNTPSRLNNLTLGMFSDLTSVFASHPVLSSRVKGAEARHLVLPIQDIWEDWHDPDSSFEVHMLRLLRALASMNACLECQTYRLPRRVAAQFRESCSSALQHYNVLSSRASEFGRGMSWHQVPKFHVMEHIAVQASFQNPRWSWTYVDEDFMGILKDIVESCSVATPWDEVMAKTIQKWRLGFGPRLAREQR